MKFRNIIGVLGIMFLVVLMSDIAGYADYTQDFTDLTDADLKTGLFEQNYTYETSNITVKEDAAQNKYASIETKFKRGVVWRAFFPKPEMGEKLEISLKYMYNAKSEVYSYKSLYLLGYSKSKAKVQQEIMIFPSGRNEFASVRSGANTEEIGAVFRANKWNDIKIIVNTYSQWADLYVNNVKVSHLYVGGSEVDFVGNGITGIGVSNNATITLGIDANYTTVPEICIDDIVVKNLSKSKIENNKVILYDNSFSKYSQGYITELKDAAVEIDNVFSVKNSGSSDAGVFILPDKTDDIRLNDNKGLCLEGENGTSEAQFKALSNGGDTVEIDFDFFPQATASGEIAVAVSGTTLFSVGKASLMVSELAHESVSDRWNRCKIVLKKTGTDATLADVYINNFCYIKDKSLADTEELSLSVTDLQGRSSMWIDNLCIGEGDYDMAFVSVSTKDSVVEGSVDSNLVVHTPLYGARGQDCVVTVKLPNGVLSENTDDIEKTRCILTFCDDKLNKSFAVKAVEDFQQASNTFSLDLRVPKNTQYIKVMLWHMDSLVPLMRFKVYN